MDPHFATFVHPAHTIRTGYPLHQWLGVHHPPAELDQPAVMGSVGFAHSTRDESPRRIRHALIQTLLPLRHSYLSYNIEWCHIFGALKQSFESNKGKARLEGGEQLEY